MGGWFYPGSGATCDTQPMIAPPSPHPQDLPLPAQHNPDPDHPSSSAAPAPAAPAAPALINPPEELVAVVEDPDGEFTPTTMDRGPLPPSSSSLLDQTSSVPVQGPYALLPPQSTPPGSSLEQSDRPQKEGRPTYRGPRIINVGVPGPGGKRLMWRRAWRDKILPAVVNFNPDLILVSAGFDAHKKVTEMSRISRCLLCHDSPCTESVLHLVAGGFEFEVCGSDRVRLRVADP